MANNELVLMVYPNCSMGGMATVFRNRIKQNPDIFYKLVFTNDLGGRSYFDGLPNVDVIIVRKDRLSNYIRYIVGILDFSEILVTSMPEIMSVAAQSVNPRAVYEFHTSTESIIQDEISRLDFAGLDAIQVPSEYLRSVVTDNLPPEYHQLLSVVPNLVDIELFSPKKSVVLNLDFFGKTPLIWVGRLDSGKNINDFLRVLSRLNDSYCAVVVLGLEHDPLRFASFLGYASTLGVKDKIRILVNLPQTGIADLYNLARTLDGYFISTSLGESFGYGVQEALDAGLNTVAYNVGALAERTVTVKNTRYSLVDVGDIDAMVDVLSK